MLKPEQLRLSLFIFCALLFLSYAYSLHIHPYRVFYNDVLITLGLILMVGSWARIPVAVLVIPGIIVVPCLFIVVILIQTLSNFILYPADMIFPVLYFLLFAVSLICGATIANQENGKHTLALALSCCFLLSGLVAVVLQHLQLLQLNLMPWVVSLNWDAPLRPFANFAQANTLALVLCFALASLWHLYATRFLRPIFAVIFAIVLLWGLALTESRIGWIIVPLFGFVMFNDRRDETKNARLVLLMCLALFIGFVMIASPFLRSLGGLADSVDDRAGQTGVRIVLWQQALAMSFEHPWLGVGWFQFGPNQVNSAAIFKVTEYSDYAHNILLNLLAEVGWPCTLLFVAGCTWWLYRCCVCNWRSVEVRYFSLILIAVGVHSMVEYPLWYGFFLFPLGLILGAMHSQRLGWQVIQLRRGWLIAFCILSLVGTELIIRDYRRMAEGYTAIAKIQEGDRSYLNNIKKPEFTLFPQFYDYFHVIEVNTEINMPQRDIEFLKRISTRFGFMPLLDRLAIACANNRQPAEALRALTSIARLNASDYPDIYEQWRYSAERNPALYADIFRRMPHPDK